MFFLILKFFFQNSLYYDDNTLLIRWITFYYFNISMLSILNNIYINITEIQNSMIVRSIIITWIVYQHINNSIFGDKVNNYFDRVVLITSLFLVKNFFVIC